MRAALSARIAIGTAVGACAAALTGSWVAGATLDDRAGTAVRAVLVVVVLVVVVVWCTRRELLAAHRSALRTWAAVGLLVGYLADPFAWQGEAFVAGAFLDGPLAWAADLVLWMAVGTVACLVTSRPAARTPQAVGYTG